MDLGIEGRVALVTGASRGLGRACAVALAAEGARVAVASRDEQRLAAAAASIEGDAKAFPADTGDLPGLTRLVEQVEAELGPIEILVTNTGGPPAGESLGFGDEAWEAAYRHLVLAPLTLIRAVVPAMRERGWGRVVNVTSIATREPIPGLVLSNSHRLAAVGLFKTLSRELAPDGVLLNSVAPGRIATDRIAELAGRPLDEIAGEPQADIPVGRLGRPEEFAAAVAFLCSERASYVSGVNLAVDGGLGRSV